MPFKSQNIQYISNLKLICALAVIVIHASAPLVLELNKAASVNWWEGNFIDSAARFAIPVFVMIMGALTLHKEYDICIFLKRKLTRIVIPFLFWSLIYIWYLYFNKQISFNNNLKENTKQIWLFLKNGSSFHLWYVYMLIGLYFFIPIISKFVRAASEKEILYYLFIWFLLMLLTQPYLVRYKPSVDMHYFAGFAGYLVLGHYLAFKDFEIKYLRLWMKLLFALTIIFIAVGTYLIISYTKLSILTFYDPLNPVLVIMGISVFLILKLSKSQLSPFMIRFRDFIVEYNYGIYLAHVVVLNLLVYFFGISYKICTPLISIFLTSTICFTITVSLVWMLNKIPIIGKWISG